MVNLSSKESHLKCWAKSELNIDINEAQINELIEKNKLLGKVLSYSVSRVRSKKHSCKFINYSTMIKLSKEIENNSIQFAKLSEDISKRVSNEHETDFEKFKKLHKLFLLIINSDLYKNFENFDQNKFENMQSTTMKICDLLQLIKAYCQDIDSIDQLILNNVEFNKFYYRAKSSTITDNDYNKTYEEIAEIIYSNFDQISTSLDNIECYSESQSGVTDKQASNKTEENIAAEFESIQSLLTNWIILNSKIDEKVDKMKLISNSANE